MSNQSVTLQAAILLQVQEFANAGRQFSVHNITQEVRNKANSGVLEIPEVEVSGASFRYDIPHVKVKAVFEDLWASGVFNPSFTLNRRFNGQYFEYTPTTNQGAPVTPATPSYTVSPSTAPTTATATPATGADTTVTDRIQLYLNNCAARNFRPTLKQVQSAIKRGDASTGWSCEKLQDYIEGLGYSVTVDPESVSSSQVVL